MKIRFNSDEIHMSMRNLTGKTSPTYREVLTKAANILKFDVEQVYGLVNRVSVEPTARAKNTDTIVVTRRGSRKG